MQDLKEELPVRAMIEKAVSMLERSYAPYSGFKVGAALLTEDGTLIGGCNIENAGLTATNCAERTAFFSALAAGVKNFRAIAIVGGRDGVLTDYCPPCGVCRQVMREFCDPESFFVITAKSTSDYRIHTLADYLPFSFGPADLA